MYLMKIMLKETWLLRKMYISCTDQRCHNWFPDFLLVRQNSFTTAYPMNCQNKLVWQLGSVHKIHSHLESTSPFQTCRSIFWPSILKMRPYFFAIYLKSLTHCTCLVGLDYIQKQSFKSLN